MCMICAQYEAKRMSYTEMVAAVKEAVGSKMMDEAHDSDDVVDNLVAIELGG